MIRERITSNSNVLKDRRKKSFVKILWILFVLVIFLIGLAFLSRIENLLIKEISVSGNEILKEDEVKNQVFKSLSKNRFYLFSGKNKFLFSKSILMEDLKKSLPRILDVEINREKEKLILKIKERKRAYLWCGENAPQYQYRSLEKDCYFLDSSGFIFDKSPQFSSGVYFTFYTEIKNKNPIGQYILDFEFLKNINLLIKAVEHKGLPVHSLLNKGQGQYEILFNIDTITTDYPKLLFTSDQSIDEVYNKFISMVDEEPFKTDFLEKKEKLEYIDTRFKNRVFYKFSE